MDSKNPYEFADLPPMVDSSDDEITRAACNADYVEAWIWQRPQHLCDHLMGLPVCALGPFLFGFSHNVSKMWITALHDSKLLITKNREKDVSQLSKAEWDLTELEFLVFKSVKGMFTSNKQMRIALDFIDELEADAESSDYIDVTKAIAKAKFCEPFPSLMSTLGPKNVVKRNFKAAQFCVIYIFKNFRDHVQAFGKYGKFLDNEIKAAWSFKKLQAEAEKFKEEGNKHFKDGKFERAVKAYTQAIKKVPLNHIFYGNRAQAYLQLKKYRDALCDGWRAVTIDNTWAKGYYRYAEAYFELGLLDKARETNNLGKMACLKTKNHDPYLRQIDEQRDKFNAEKERLLQFQQKHNRNIPDLVSDSNDSEDEFDEQPGILSDSDDEFPPVKNTKMGFKKGAIMKVVSSFIQNLHKASDAVRKDDYSTAMKSYHSALNIYNSNGSLKRTYTEVEYVVLKYAYAYVCLHTNVMESIVKFQDIINNHSKVKFPACYYGLGKAYIIMNRFSQAQDPINSGLAAVKNGVKLRSCNWPGSDLPIPETKKEKLKEMLLELLDVCRHPPSPDATCRYPECPDADSPAIYNNDPDYKGFVRVTCQSFCIVDFHMSCWKSHKSYRSEKTSDKRQLDTLCPTPDCVSSILKISIYKHGVNTPETIVSNKPATKDVKLTKKVVRVEPSSQDNISRKAEKKARRKLKKQEAREQCEADDIEQELEESRLMSLGRKRVNNELVVDARNNADAVVYKKSDILEEEELNIKVKAKSTKQKKKKKESKQVLNVEINFTDGREQYMLNEYSVDMEPEKIPTATSQFATLPGVYQPVNQFHPVAIADPFPYNDQRNEVADNLFVYFAELLGEHGPLPLNHRMLQKELEDFPKEAKDVIEMYGGLRKFLQESCKFGFIDDVVCVISDAVKAKAIAIAMNDPNVNPVTLNPSARLFVPSGPSFADSVAGGTSAVPSLAGNVPVATSSYNSLDDFVIPQKIKLKKPANFVLMDNMDDIDDVQLCGDDMLEDNELVDVHWTKPTHEKLSANLETIGNGKLLTRIIPKPPSSVRSLSSLKSEEVSRCSSRSSLSDYGDLDNGYRASSQSPALKSGVSKASSKSEITNTTELSFPNNSVLSGNGDCHKDFTKNQIQTAGVFPSYPLSFLPKNVIGAESGSSGVMTRGSGDFRVVNDTFSDTFPSSLPSELPSTFSTFQDRLVNQAQQSSYKWPQTNDSWTKLLMQQFVENVAVPTSTPNSIWNNSRETIEVGVQTMSEVFTVATNTELDLNELLRHTLALQENQQRFMESLRLSEEQKMDWMRKFSVLKDKCDVQEDVYQSQINQLEQHMNEFKQKQLSDEKTKKLSSLVVDLQTKCSDYTERAVYAEKEYLHLKLQIALQPFNGIKREASFHHHHLLNFIRKCGEEGRDVPSKVYSIIKHFTSVMETCENNTTNTKNQYKDSLEQIQNGCSIRDLPPFKVLTPPTAIPPEIATEMSQLFGSSSSNASRYVMSMSPTEGQPKSLPEPPSRILPLTPTASVYSTVNEALVQPKPLQPLLRKPAQSLDQSQTSKSTYDILISKIQSIVPQYSRSQCQSMLVQFRESRGGTLSGLGGSKIIKGVIGEFAKSEKKSPSTLAQDQVWGVTSNPQEMLESYPEEEDPCVICHEELHTTGSSNLNCGHTFHTECIRAWFKEQSTCPNCRVHALLLDDFPTLK